MSDFKKLPTVNGTGVSLVGHTHSMQEITGAATARLRKNVTQNVTANISTKVGFEVADYDYSNAWYYVNNRFVAPVSNARVYRVTATVRINTSGAGYIALYKNGVQYCQLFNSSANNITFFTGTTDVNVAGGGYLELWINVTQNKTIQIADTNLCISGVF